MNATDIEQAEKSLLAEAVLWKLDMVTRLSNI